MNAPTKMISMMAFLALGACGTDNAQLAGLGGASDAMAFKNSAWSAPVSVGAGVNSPFQDFTPCITKDELTLFFASNRPGGKGGNDLYVAFRESTADQFGPPVNLGATLNTSSNEGGPSLSPDGLIMLFNSNRAGVIGKTDLFMTRRTDVTDPFGWGKPVNLGSLVNTKDIEQNASAFEENDDDAADYDSEIAAEATEVKTWTVYFDKGINVLNTHIFTFQMDSNAVISGPVVAVSSLNGATGYESHVALRQDGRELFYQSNRTVFPGANSDLWVVTRQDRNVDWGAPVNVTALNNATDQWHPVLSENGKTIYFATGFAPDVNIMMATRTPNGK